MIEAIRQLGVYLLERTNKTLNDMTEVFVEDPASNPSYKNVLVINLNWNDSNITYRNVNLELYSANKITKYLYRQGSARGTDLTPTARITEIEKTFKNKILQWFSDILNDKTLQLTKNTESIFQNIQQCLKNNQERIIVDLNNQKNNFKSKETGIITLKISLKGDEHYLGDLSYFKDIFLKKSLVSFYQKYDVESRGMNQVCSVCRVLSSEVYGFVDTYKFYTVDKPGFVVGGFDQSFAWRNYPVCQNCVLLLEEGKKYIEKNLTFYSYGFEYFILPKLFNNEKINEIFGIIEVFRADLNKSQITITQAHGNLLTENEADLLRVMQSVPNYMNLNIMFYEISNAAFRILLYVEDILPSHLHHLFDIKEKIDQKSLYVLMKNEEKKFEFSFRNIRYFFPKKDVDENLELDKYFLEIANAIFTSKPIDYHFLISRFVKKIHTEFINNKNTRYSAFTAWQLLDYLNCLEILQHISKQKKYFLNNKEPEFEFLTEIKNTEIGQVAEKLFKEYSDFFDDSLPAKRAIFLEGALTQKLLNIQYRDRNAAPFRHKLQGLKLDQRQIKKLLPEIINKLEEYKKNYYKDMEKLISHYFLCAGSEWGLTNNEISFYFVLGMNLHELFRLSEDTEQDIADVIQ